MLRQRNGPLMSISGEPPLALRGKKGRISLVEGVPPPLIRVVRPTLGEGNPPQR
jgi:hypothetical protein